MRLLRLTLPFFTLLSLAGCHAGAIDDRAEKQLSEARATAELRVSYATCADGRPFGPNCGYLLAHVNTPEFRERFRDKVCTGHSNEDCQARFERSIDAWLAQRYWAADQRAVALSCDANPASCNEPVAYERMLLDSHNSHVRANLVQDEISIEAERRARHAVDVDTATLTAGVVVGTALAVSGHATMYRCYPTIFGGTACTKSRF